MASASAWRPRLRSDQATIHRATRIVSMSPIRSRASSASSKTPSAATWSPCVGIGHADVVEQRGVPVTGTRVVGVPGDVERGHVDRDLVVGLGHQGGHVHRVDAQVVAARLLRQPLGLGEALPRLGWIPGRAQQSTTLERDVNGHVTAGAGEPIEDLVSLVVFLLQAERARHLGQVRRTVVPFRRGCSLAKATL